MATWEHRVYRRKAHPSYGEWEYSIREDYGERGYTKDAIAPYGESLESLRWVLTKMLKALDKPVLEDK